MTSVRVFPFLYARFKDEAARPMRVVVTDERVDVEMLDGRDATGAERWIDVDLDVADSRSEPCETPLGWVTMAVRAVLADRLSEVQP
jgi:hypothetical protein